MIWINFPLYTLIALTFWLLGIVFLYFNSKSNLLKIFAMSFLAIGIAVLVLFTIQLWMMLERPPLRTLGETRLWYSLFLPVVGLLTYIRWRYKWFITYTFALAAIFAKIYAYMDTFLIKIFLGDEEVGFYSVAYKITFALQFIPLAFVAALYPAFSNYSASV